MVGGQRFQALADQLAAEYGGWGRLSVSERLLAEQI
jgi:hypothetical protein